MNTRDLNAMAIVVSGDTRDREEKGSLDALIAAEDSLRKLADAPSLAREPAEERVLDAKAVCQEFGAVGSECR